MTFATPQEALVLSVIKQLSFCRTVQEVMKIVRVAARDLTGADGVTFVLREGDSVYYAEENAIGPLWKGRRFPATACISGWVMLNREPAIIEDIYEDPRIPHDAYRPTFVKSLLMTPVRSDDPVAAIGAYWAERHLPTKIEVESVQVLADATALALENAQLYSELTLALDRERQARLEAEAANRAKDQWLSIISHELRTPLTPIHGFLKLLLNRSVQGEKALDALRVIDRNLTAHIRLVEDLLDVSRILSGKFELQTSLVDLRDCVADAVLTQRGAAQAKSIALRVDGDRSCPVRGDSDRLRQVVSNLLHNAIKFTPEGGNIDVSLAERQGHAELSVRDNGAGMTPEVLSQLFVARFHQADRSITRNDGGLGLGLWIVRQLVELHHGSVAAESAGEGMGSTLTVRLPLARPKDPLPPKPARTSEGSSPSRSLRS